MQRQAIVLLTMVLGSVTCTAWAISTPGNSTATAGLFGVWLSSGLSALNHFMLPQSEPARLIVMGVLLIGLSVAVRRGMAGKRGR